jgi:hypothetical protein
MPDLFKQVLWNDGEGITDGDLNLSQRNLSARLFDQLLREMRRQSTMPLTAVASHDPEMACGQAAIDVTRHCFALTAGGGFIVPGAVARHIRCRAGTILQHTGVPAGAEETLLPYTFVDDEIDLTLAVGDATNPRIDLIEVQLAFVNGDPTSRDFKDASTFALTTTTPNITRRVVATVQVKAGTPAATPLHPDVTAGFCAMGAVYVPALHNAVFTRAQLMDTRFPLGVSVYDVPSWQFDRGASAAAWIIGTTTGRRSVASPTNTDPFLIHIPKHGQTSRVVGFGIHGTWATGGGSANLVRLVRVTYGNGVPVITEIADLTSLLTGTGTPAFRYVTFDALMELGTPGDAAHGLRSAVNACGDPIWANGWRGGPIQEYLNLNPAPRNNVEHLAIEVNGNDVSEVWMARWVMAEGL